MKKEDSNVKHIIFNAKEIERRLIKAHRVVEEHLTKMVLAAGKSKGEQDVAIGIAFELLGIMFLHKAGEKQYQDALGRIRNRRGELK